MKLPFALPDLSKLSRRERLLAAGSLLMLCVVLLDRVVLGPWWRHTQKVSQEIHRLEGAIRNDQQLISRKPMILAETQGYGEQLRALGEHSVDMASLVREIEALGAESGVSLGEVKPLTETTTEAQPGQAIDVRYQSSLEQWVHFLYLLASSNSLLEIERVTVAVTEKDPSVLEGSVRLTSKALRAPSST